MSPGLQVSTQDYESKIIRNAAILTNAYVAGAILDGPTTVGMHLMNQLNLYIDFTKGSLDSVSLKVEFSNDYVAGINEGTWYQETFESVSGATATDTLGVHTISTTGKYRLLINIKDKYVRVSAIGTGTVTSSSLSILGIYGVI